MVGRVLGAPGPAQRPFTQNLELASTLRDEHPGPSRATLRWLAVLLGTGVAAGMVGILITLLLHGVQHAAFGYTENTFLVGVEQASPVRRVLVLLVAGAIVGAGWWLLRTRARVVTVTDAVDDPTRAFPVFSTTVDAGLQILAVGMGASLGREGAPRQVSAAIGGWLATRAHLSGPQRRVAIAAGAGAGLAAVYDVPLGGALFACEVLLHTWSWRALVPAAVVNAVATVTSWLVLPNRPIYQIGHVSLSASLCVFALVIAGLSALAGRGFGLLMTLARSGQPRPSRLPLTCIGVLTGLGALAVAYPQVLGNGKGPTQLALDGTVSLGTAGAILVLKPLVTAACLRAGIGGGLLTPALATGALLGITTGRLWSHLWPGSPLAGCALLGATAALAVTQQAPICAIALAVEFTHPGLDALLPVALAAILATALAPSRPSHALPLLASVSVRQEPANPDQLDAQPHQIHRGKDQDMTNIEDRTKTIEDISVRVAKKHPAVHLDEIDAAVTETYSQYDDSPIREFVPVLVERSVNQDLHDR